MKCYQTVFYMTLPFFFTFSQRNQYKHGMVGVRKYYFFGNGEEIVCMEMERKNCAVTF